MPDMVDLSGFGAEVIVLTARVQELQTLAQGSGQPEYLMDEVVAELQTTTEELRVSYEELCAQHDALAEAGRRIEEEEDRYRALFEAAPVPYVVTDLRGVVRAANSAALRLFGVDARFLPGKPLISFIPPGRRGDVRRLITEVTGQKRPVSTDGEVQPRRRPAVPATLDLGLLQRGGGADALLWLIRDRTRERSLEERAGELTERLVDRLDRESSLLTAADLAAAEVTGRLLDEESYEGVLAAIAAAAARFLPGVTGAGVSVFEQGRPRETGSSTPLVAHLDEAQFRLEEGPAIDALSSGEAQVGEELSADGRWGRWVQAVATQGVVGTAGLPLIARGATVGVLTLYADKPGVLDAAALAAAQRFCRTVAVTAANALLVAANRRLSDELSQALVSRSTIDMAKGVLMAKLNIGPDAAFEALRTLSQQRHLKLRELAARIVEELA
jgi:PAS domain S-box-containing protein